MRTSRDSCLGRCASTATVKEGAELAGVRDPGDVAGATVHDGLGRGAAFVVGLGHSLPC